MFNLLLGFFFTFLLGYLLVFTLMKSASPGERVALSPALGFGVVSLLLFFLFVFELLINEAQFLCILAGLCFFLITVCKREVFLVGGSSEHQNRSIKASFDSIWCLVLLLFGLSFLFSSTFPVFITDGNNYETTGRLIAFNRSVDLEYFFRPYAPFIPLIYSFVYFLGGAHPKIIFSLFYLSLTALFYINMKRETHDQRLTVIFTGIIASTPFLWWHSYLGLLNFAAGYFFVLGCLYLIGCLGNDRDTGRVIISGIGFGLAAFTRLEYLVYFLVPFLLFLCSKNKGVKRVLAFSLPALLPSTLWSVYKGIGFGGEDAIYTSEEILITASFWGVLILSCLGRWSLFSFPEFTWRKRKGLLCLGMFLCVLFGALLFSQSAITFLSSVRTLGVVVRTGTCVVFRLLAGNLFWMFTSSLVLLLFFKSFREGFSINRVGATSFLIGAYYLLHIIIHTYHTYSHDPAGTHPYHVSLLSNLKWVFLTPGSFFNTSEVRDLLAINPLMIFLCGQVCCLSKIKEKGRILLSQFILIIVCLNIFTLAVVFLYPRLTYLYEYRDANLREILLSPGPRDNPNMEHLRRIYKLMYFVKDHSEKDSVVFFINPYFSKAEALKVLLPRKVRFVSGDEPESFLSVDQNLYGERKYLVFKKDTIPHFVKEKEIMWSEDGWVICKIW